MAADSVVRPWTLLLGRTTAVLTIGSAALHLVGAPAHGVAVGVVLVAMAAACFRCVPALWRRPVPGTFGLVACMTLAMLAVHATMVGGGAHGHAGHGDPVGLAALDPLTAITLVVAASEALVAVVAVFLTTRSPAGSLVAG
ncbi:hypothetical protein ACFVVM_19510 [Nocardia sp. NPDC058176]|uniref:hypothetical protein n=1 Tax=Nocardia sp. NPDC058176 TaxID=3346368 RepID=UPI0036D78332